MLEIIDKLVGWWMQARYEWACRHVPEIREQIEQFGLKSIDTIPGGWEATFVTPAVAMIAEDMAEMLDRASAKNFIQFDFMPRLDRDMKPVRVTVQWASGESPAKKAARLEDEIAEAHAQLDVFAQEAGREILSREYSLDQRVHSALYEDSK